MCVEAWFCEIRSHILKVTNKARQVNAFLHRNISNCPTHVKCNIYKIMVRPILEYGSTIWDPHTHRNINLLESIQRTAARFCYNNYFKLSSASRMLNQPSLPNLQQRRKRSKCIMMFKIINNLIDIPASHFVPKQCLLRGGYYIHLSTKTDSYKFSFFPSVIKLWNSLPPPVVNFLILNDFCINLDTYMHNTCAL